MVVTFLPCAWTARVRHETHAAPVDVNRAGAALTVVASFLGAMKAEPLPECVQQRHSRLDLQQMDPAIHHDVHTNGHERLLSWRPCDTAKNLGATCERASRTICAVPWDEIDAAEAPW